MREYADTWALTEVWYAQEWGVWATTAYDSDGNQVGESEYDHLKVDAEDTARAYLDSERCQLVRVRRKGGTTERIYAKGIRG